MILPLISSNLNRFVKFFHFVKEEEISNIFRCILNNYVAALPCQITDTYTSNMTQMWKKMKTKCIDFACTEYNLSTADLFITSFSGY